MSETAQTLIGLALVSPDDHLLVVETARGQLDLPGLEIGEPGTSAGHLAKLLSKLGLDQMVRQTLYLPALRLRRQQATPITGVIQLVRLTKAQHFEIPNSRYERTKTLADDDTASPVTRAVARWLLQGQA